MPIVSITATIAAGQSVSNAIDFGNNAVVGLIMPIQWTTAHVTVLVSPDNIKFYDLFSRDDEGGTSLTEVRFNVVTNSIVAIDPDRLLMGRYLKLRSGTRNEPIPQSEARIFTVITRNMVTAAMPADDEQ